MLLFIAIAANIMTAVAYGAMAVWIAPRFVLFAPTNVIRVARIAGALFFLGTAGTHIELAVQAWTAGIPLSDGGVGAWFTSWHGMAIHITQAVAAWTFLWVSYVFLNVRIYSKRYYKILGEKFRLIEEHEQELIELVEEYRRRGQEIIKD